MTKNEVQLLHALRLMTEALAAHVILDEQDMDDRIKMNAMANLAIDTARPVLAKYKDEVIHPGDLT